MKNLLKMLAVMVLFGATNTSIAACNEKIVYQKFDLNDIIKDEELSLTFDNAKLYTDLNEDIIRDICIFDYIKLQPGYQFKYYRDQLCKEEITTNKQMEGDFYFTITAIASDPYWIGTSQQLKLKLASV